MESVETLRPSRPSEHYEDVALGAAGGGGGGDVGDVNIAVDETDQRDHQHSSDPPSSGPEETTATASLTGHPATSYYPPTRSVEASYPPLPSFSRPSDSRISTDFSPSSPFSPGTNADPSTRASAPRSPPVRATFARLRAILDAQSPALLDSLSPPLPSTDPALASLKAAIAPYRLPQAVIDSYLLAHDGQDVLALGGSASGGASGGASLGGLGLVYGLWWLPLDRVEEEWRFWRRLEEAGGLVGAGVGGDPFAANAAEAANRSRHASRTHPYIPEEAESAQASTSGGKAPAGGGADDGKGTLMQGMASFPDGWVRNRYSHPGWLPLLTDRCGNYIGIDLDPPPPPPATRSEGTGAGAGPARQRGYGQPGQVIAFGREIDEKVVLFPGDGPSGWARFLAAFVEDLEKGEFARLGERPTTRDAPGRRSDWRAGAQWSDEEHSGLGRNGSDGSDEGYDGLGDGLGERGYFETNLYGDEAVGSSARSAQTWVLRPEYRRLSDELSLEGGVIALLCERSRRKWQSLGVGSNHPAHRRTISIPILRDGMLIPSPRKAAALAASKNAAVEQRRDQDENDQYASAADPAVSLVLSPPSPKKSSAFSTQQPSSPPESAAAPGSEPTSPRNDSSSGLRSPARPSFKLNSHKNNGRSASTRRPPPPPPAPLDLPVFSELDFSDALGHQQPRPIVPPSTASWLLADPPVSRSLGARKGSASSASGGGGGAMAEATNMLSRLSFGSSSTSPLASPTLLPLAQNSMSAQQAMAAAASEDEYLASRTALVGSPSLGPPSPTSDATRSPTLSDSHVVVVEHH